MTIQLPVDLDVQATEPRVGVGVIVFREGLVLLGLRKGSHGACTWAPPGGHLEFGESIEECAAREVREETGLEVIAVSLGPYTNDVFQTDRKHYVTLFTVAQCAAGEPKVLEPQRCARWQWFPWSNLPAPLFQPLTTLQCTGYVPQNIRHTFGSAMEFAQQVDELARRSGPAHPLCRRPD